MTKDDSSRKGPDLLLDEADALFGCRTEARDGSARQGEHPTILEQLVDDPRDLDEIDRVRAYFGDEANERRPLSKTEERHFRDWSPVPVMSFAEAYANLLFRRSWAAPREDAILRACLKRFDAVLGGPDEPTSEAWEKLSRSVDGVRPNAKGAKETEPHERALFAAYVGEATDRIRRGFQRGLLECDGSNESYLVASEELIERVSRLEGARKPGDSTESVIARLAPDRELVAARLKCVSEKRALVTQSASVQTFADVAKSPKKGASHKALIRNLAQHWNAFGDGACQDEDLKKRWDPFI